MANESFVATLSLPPGSPGLDLYSFQGTEALSRLYSYSVVALALPNVAVKFNDLLGNPAELKVQDKGGADRHYHGLIASARFEGTVGEHHAYRFELVPWLWLLTRSANVRVFQNLTTIEIIKQVCATPYHGALTDNTSGTYKKREYCVQYRESDFNFISRLMEDEGIYYFFKHSAGKHEMILADAANVHVNELGVSSLKYNVSARRRTQGAVITRWAWSQQVQTGKVELRDYYFERAGEIAAAAAAAKPPAGMAHADIEAYDSPFGLAAFGPESSSMPGGVAMHRLQAYQVGAAAADGATSSLRLCNGARFTLAEHPVAGQNGEYIVQSTTTRVRVGGYDSGAHKDSTHECDFTAFPSAVPYRAARITPKPRVHGLHSAVVVGKAGEEIWTDKYGRVKVQFHWDRLGKSDEKSSCFVRVAQASAGKQFGVVMLPRIGQEVVVDFLEGDPDQPLIVGSVYNSTNMPPYALPANQTVSTIKTNSSKGGGGFNELKFDDKKGEELLYLQAEKDRTELVKNDLKTDVNNDLTLTIKNNRTEAVKGKYDLTVTKAITTKTDDAYSLTAAKDVSVDTKANVKVKATQAVEISATTKLTLKCGGSQIEMTPAGITIKGSLVTAEAQGLMTIKGALVKVN